MDQTPSPSKFNFKLNSKIIPTLVGIASISIILSALKIDGSNQILMISAFSLAGVLALQAYAKNDLFPGILVVLQRVLNLGMAVCTIGVLFRFLYWNGWQLELMVGLLTMIFSFIVVLFMRNKILGMVGGQMSYIKYNYLLPIAFLLITSFMALGLQDKQFYETFSIRSKTQTYEDFKAEQKYRPGIDSSKRDR